MFSGWLILINCNGPHSMIFLVCDKRVRCVDRFWSNWRSDFREWGVEEVCGVSVCVVINFCCRLRLQYVSKLTETTRLRFLVRVHWSRLSDNVPDITISATSRFEMHFRYCCSWFAGACIQQAMHSSLLYAILVQIIQHCGPSVQNHQKLLRILKNQLSGHYYVVHITGQKLQPKLQRLGTSWMSIWTENSPCLRLPPVLSQTPAWVRCLLCLLL
jgi:hypothetical protein